jgi:hypothetical protein
LDGCELELELLDLLPPPQPVRIAAKAKLRTTHLIPMLGLVNFIIYYRLTIFPLE